MAADAEDDLLMPAHITDLRACLEAASRVNPDSPHRRELRSILRQHDLHVAALVVTAAYFPEVYNEARDLLAEGRRA